MNRNAEFNDKAVGMDRAMGNEYWVYPSYCEPPRECLKVFAHQGKRIDLGMALRMMLYSMKVDSLYVFHDMKNIRFPNEMHSLRSFESGLKNTLYDIFLELPHMIGFYGQRDCTQWQKKPFHILYAEGLAKLMRSWNFVVSYDREMKRSKAACETWANVSDYIEDAGKLEFIFCLIRVFLTCGASYAKVSGTINYVSLAHITCSGKNTSGSAAPDHASQYLSASCADGDVAATLGLFAHLQNDPDSIAKTGGCEFRLNDLVNHRIKGCGWEDFYSRYN